MIFPIWRRPGDARKTKTRGDNGTFVGQDALLGVDTGSTGYVSAEGRQQMSEDVQAKMAETYELLRKGEIVPPTTSDGLNNFPGLQ